MYCWLRDVCVCAGLPIVYLGNSSHLRFCDLVRVDTIEVEVLPEKKGVFMKHVEYLITSKVSLLWEATRSQTTTFHVCLLYYTVFQIKKVITLSQTTTMLFHSRMHAVSQNFSTYFKYLN